MQSTDEVTEAPALAERLALERGSATTAAADLLVPLFREEDPSLPPLPA